jgi:cation diffusion facilitator CzcD-associated flavoprotein CzcO
VGVSREIEHDVVVIGAGINGLFQLFRLREAGVDVMCLEAGESVGGTWYWNRYPGARLDSECYSYTYHFSPELVAEWDWEEEFASQPKLSSYFEFVADRLDLRRSIIFGARVGTAIWDERARRWHIRTEDGLRVACRFMVAASGILSAPNFPDFPGLNEFRGATFHTSDWPRHGVDLADKKVAVLGVGSTGIQVVQTIASSVAHLTVAQRTPNWATPLNNFTFSPARRQEVKDRSDEFYAFTMQSRTCFMHSPHSDSASDHSPEEQEAILQTLYDAPGMSMYQGAFRDLLTDEATNKVVTDFLTRKIAERVHDPRTAKKLTPSHPFGVKRPPLETGYYEVYNQRNVELVSLPDEPIVRFTHDGLQTAERFFELDVVIAATGFDAVTGSFVRLGLEGVGGLRLRDWWESGPRTYLGIASHNFPNLFILGGPQGVNGNQPRCAEFVADWITNCLRTFIRDGVERFEVEQEVEERWVEYCSDLVEQTLLTRGESWQWGSNIAGKRRVYALYIGPQEDLRRRLRELEGDDYALLQPQLSAPRHAVPFESIEGAR